MTEKTFLKNFRKHCEIARNLGIYSKKYMFQSLHRGKCPFTAGNLMVDKTMREAKRDKLFNRSEYWPTAEFYEDSEIKPTFKMITILKSIPWRKGK